MDTPHAVPDVAQPPSPVRLLLIAAGALLALGVLLAAPALACTPLASVTFAPNTAEAGTTVQVTGGKFQANEPVQIHLHTASGPLLAQTATDFHGVFSTPVTLPAGTPAGTVAIMVRQAEVPGGALIHREGSTYPGGERMVAFTVAGAAEEVEPPPTQAVAEPVATEAAPVGRQPETVPASSTGTQPETVGTTPTQTPPMGSTPPRTGTDPIAGSPPAAPTTETDTHTPVAPANPSPAATAPGELAAPAAESQPRVHASAPAGTQAAADDGRDGVPARAVLSTRERVLLATGSTASDVPRALTAGERMLLAAAPEPDVRSLSERTPGLGQSPTESAPGHRAASEPADQRGLSGTGTPGTGLGLLAIGLVLMFGGFTVVAATQRRQTRQATRRPR